MLLALAAGSQTVPATEITEADVSLVNKLLLEPECKIDAPDRLSPLLAPIIPGLIDSTVGSIIGAIKNAGEDSTRTIEVSNSDFFYALDKDKKKFQAKSGCLIIVVGSSVDDPKRDDPVGVGGDDAFDGKIDMVKQTGTTAGASEIDLLVELRIDNSKDNSAFRLVANSFYVAKYAHKSRSNRARNYVVTVELRRPGTKAESVQASLTLPVVGSVEKETFYDANILDGMGIRSRWIPYPAVSDASKAQLDAYTEFLAAGKLLADKEKKRSACSDSSLDKDACLKATYPELATSTANLTNLLALHETKLEAKKKFDEYEFAELDAVAQAERNLGDAEKKIADEIEKLTFAAKQGCKLYDAYAIGFCLGSELVRGDQGCPRPPNRKCEFTDGTGGVEFMEWSVAVTETRPGSAFMKKLGEILESGQSGIVDQLKSDLDPATIAAQAEVDEAARQAHMTLSDSLRVAQQEVQILGLALDAAESESARLQAEFDIINKKHAANAIATQLGVPLPYDL